MEEDLKQRLDNQDQMLAKIYISTEKTRKYFMWTLIISVVMFVLPLIGIAFILPGVLSSYSKMLGGLSF